MAVQSATDIQKTLQSLLPKSVAETRVVPVTEFRGQYGTEMRYDPSWGIEREIDVPIKSFTGRYFSPSLNRELTPEESRYIRPVVNQEGAEVGKFFVGEKLSNFLAQSKISPDYISAQETPSGGISFNPMPAMPTSAGEKTNFAVSYGGSGEPAIKSYQSDTLFGNEKIDKLVDQLAKAANTALLTYTGGLALGPLGTGLLSTPSYAGALSGAGQAAIKGGDTKDILSGALSGYLMEPGARELAAAAAGDLAKIEASMGTPTTATPAEAPVTSGRRFGFRSQPSALDYSTISPDVAAANTAAIEAALGAPVVDPQVAEILNTPITAADELTRGRGFAGFRGSAPLDYSAISPDVAAGNVAALEQSIVSGQLADLQAQLANTPETITEMRRGKLGQMRAVSVPNPEYTNIQNQIAALQQPALSTTIPVTPAVVETPAGLLSPEVQMQAPSVINEPVLVPGDNRLVSTLAETPPVVETPAGVLSPEARSLLDQPSILDIVSEAAPYTETGSAKVPTGTTATGGDLARATLYGNEGYGELSNQTITQAPITTSPITSLGPAATLDDVIKYITGGGFLGGVTDALKSGLSKAFGGQDVKGTGGPNLSAIALGALLNRQQPSAPSLSVIPGKAVDITSPIQSLLAPKLVQQRPVSLL